MIVGSVVLVVAAGVLLGLGLVFLDGSLLYSSIGVSALAGLALFVGVRRLASVRAGQGVIAVRPGGATLRAGSTAVRPDVAAPPGRPDPPGPVTGRAMPRPIGRATPRPVGRAPVGGGTPANDIDSLVPDDEPAAQVLSETEAARIGVLDAEVVVVDGRPRYHVAGCDDLLGVELDGFDAGPDDVAEAIPVVEAVALGFTPCGVCRPATALLRAEET